MLLHVTVGSTDFDPYLRQINDIRAEIRDILDDPAFDTLIPRAGLHSTGHSSFSSQLTLINVKDTAEALFTHIDAVLGLYLTPKSQAMAENVAAKGKVFIGHGHNEIVLNRVKNFVQDRCRLDPIVLNLLPSTGLTIIEKLEKYGRAADYAVLIMTADDETTSGLPRARQNVIQELGWFQGVLGRNRTAIVQQAGVEIASNLSGIVLLRFEGDAVEAVFDRLRQEFEAAALMSH
jgi:predicted nucleotide-binding protein